MTTRNGYCVKCRTLFYDALRVKRRMVGKAGQAIYEFLCPVDHEVIEFRFVDGAEEVRQDLTETVGHVGAVTALVDQHTASIEASQTQIEQTKAELTATKTELAAAKAEVEATKTEIQKLKATK